ncbi:MAG: hypothetical protein LBC91_05560 [Candidatus Accumulibacter sp.]|jgi:hypothetical protein|nr:hypothetical protein [Accumulibacter sp.]
MSFQALSVVSGLAYLALCLLIAVSRAWGKCPREGGSEKAFIIVPPVEENGGRFLSPLSLSCLVSLSSFLFMPCGTLSSLLPASGGALVILGGLTLALVLRGVRERVRGVRESREWAYRQVCVPLCLAVSLAAVAHYARQRGVPGELYALDAYVAMPLTSVTDAWGKSGLCVLAVASLLALYGALPARRLPSGEEKRPEAGDAFLATLAAEIWMLAAITFWVCLFFPHSLACGRVPMISALGGLALNALIFWGKVLGLEWLLEKLREKCSRDLPFHAPVLLTLSGLGAGLLLLDAPAA